MFRIAFIFILSLLLLACSPAEQKTKVKIATNPWPGYEFLHLAEHLGYFEKVGLNIELVQLGSLSDVQQAYMQGVVDGFTSTLVEVVLVTELTQKNPKVVLIPDYSNGGDVIMASSDITSFEDIKNKKVGAEIASLGIFVLERALAKHGLSINDVELVNTEQSEGKRMLDSGLISAFVSYPPFSIEIEKSGNYHAIFDTSEIPNQVIDTVSISESVVKENPEFQKQLFKVWQMALDYQSANETQANEIMAARQRISVDEFEAVLGDISILSTAQQRNLLQSNESLVDSALKVCQALITAGTLSSSCERSKHIF